MLVLERPLDVTTLQPEAQEELLALLAEYERQAKQNHIDDFYPDTGPLRRDLYQRHLEFFWAGGRFRERCAMAGNRIGKTEGMGGYETALHLTGQYPVWWPGRRFDAPISAWAAGKTNETTRDIVQRKLFGPISWHTGDKTVAGTGLVRGNCIGRLTWKQGVQDLLDTIAIKHVSGGWSILGLKSYQQGRGSFEGTEQDVVWLDEEPPEDIYGECLVRTATTNGLVYITFTPLEGITGTVLGFMPGGSRELMDA